MANYGIKVSQPGYDVVTATPSQLAFSSKYRTLKVKQQGSGTVTHTGGRTITIAHNLGYVPMFVVHSTADPGFTAYYANSSDYFVCPLVLPGIDSCFLDRHVTAYADTTNLYIKIGSDFGWYYYGVNDYVSDGTLYVRNTALLGNSSVLDPYDAAFRFAVSLTQGESIYEAHLGYRISEKDGTDGVNCDIYGVDEDNVSDFDENPFSKDKTTATYSETVSGSFNEGDTWNVGITSIVQEIIGRGGWSSGNNIAILFFDDSTIDGNYIATQSSDESGYPTCTFSYIRVLKSNTLASYKYTIFYNEVDP